MNLLLLVVLVSIGLVWCVEVDRQPSVRVFTVQKDAYRYLNSWVHHHGKIFGYSNIHVIDNVSSHSKVLKLLDHYRGLGVHVLTNNTGFVDKHLVLTDVMTKYKGTDDLLVPLDIDEFIVAVNPDNVTFSADAQPILSKFKALFNQPKRENIDKYKFGQFEGILCDQLKFNQSSKTTLDDLVFAVQLTTCVGKTFYGAKSFISTDAGNHVGTSSIGDPHCHKFAPMFQDMFTNGANCGKGCFDFDTGLAILHTGGSFSMSYEEWRHKTMSRLMSLSWREDEVTAIKDREICSGPRIVVGVHYCHDIVDINTIPIDQLKIKHFSLRNQACSVTPHQNILHSYKF